MKHPSPWLRSGHCPSEHTSAEFLQGRGGNPHFEGEEKNFFKNLKRKKKRKKSNRAFCVWFSLKHGSCLKAAYKLKMFGAGIGSSNLVLTAREERISRPQMLLRGLRGNSELLRGCNTLVNYV